jgi:hypothetical protein
LWVAFGYIPASGKARNILIQRQEASIAREFRRISEVEPETNHRKLRAGDQKLVLSHDEIELLKERIEAFPHWNPLADPSPADVYDWLDSGKDTE